MKFSAHKFVFSLALVLGLLFFSAGAQAATVVKPLTDVAAHADPSGSSKTVMTVATRQPLTGSATRLLVTDTVQDGEGQRWYRVLLPGRGKKTGWVAGNTVSTDSVVYRITVSLRARKATVYKNNKQVRSFRVVIGAKKTPTTRGQFQIMEIVHQRQGTDTGPYVLALNAYSNVLQEFAGGPGQIGLHGRTGLRDPLGSAASHGCVRFADKDIVWLARRVSAGTPVTIR